MSTVTLKVASLHEATQDFKQVWNSQIPQADSITFASWDLMHRTLTPKKLSLIQALCGQQPMSIRELARRVNRDFKGVHTDVTALVNAGLVDREDSRISFPYDNIHVEFDIHAAA